MPTATSVVGLAAEFQDHNYRQCWDYAAMLAARANAAAECVVVTRSGVPAGLASVCVKRLPHMRTGIAYVAGGPLVRHREDTSARERLDRAGRADAGVRRAPSPRPPRGAADRGHGKEHLRRVPAGGGIPPPPGPCGRIARCWSTSTGPRPTSGAGSRRSGATT